MVELLLKMKSVPGLETHFLRGNHDQALVDFLNDPEFGPVWGDFGGREALRSYGAGGVERGHPIGPPGLFPRPGAEFTLGDYFFAHAGARPGLPLDLQEERDFYWIREPFLSDTRAFDKLVVHGHSADVAIHADNRRIGIDTGATPPAN